MQINKNLIELNIWKKKSCQIAYCYFFIIIKIIVSNNVDIFLK
jgi:hypothetical protein